MSPLRISRSVGWEAGFFVILVLICSENPIGAQQSLRPWSGSGGWFALDGEARFGHLGRSGSVIADADGLLLLAPAMGTSRAVLRLRTMDGSAFVYGTVASAPGRLNFLLGSDPASHRRGVQCWSRIRGIDQNTGIAWELLHERGAVRYDLVLPHGMAPSGVRLAFDGADHLETTGDGGLLIHVGGYVLRQGRPLLVVERGDGSRLEVPARCVVDADQGFAFVPTENLPPGRVRIDPRLEWASYLGGSVTFDDVRTFSSGPSNTIIAAGTSQSLGGFFGGNNDFPLTPGAYQTTAQQRTAFLCCMPDDGDDALMWSTFLGGGGSDALNSLHVDAIGTVTICGSTTSANFPTTPFAFQTTLQGGTDGWVARLDSTGSTLLYGTYLGGSIGGQGLSPDDHLTCLDVTASGTIFVAGHTHSSNMPTTIGAAFPAHLGHEDGWVAHIDPGALGALQLLSASYFGSSEDDRIRGLKLSFSNELILVGQTQIRPPCIPSPFGPTCPVAAAFPITPMAWQTLRSGLLDGFVARMSADATTILASTFVGGDGADALAAVAEASNGDVLVAGTSDGSGPLIPFGGLQAAPSLGMSAFLLLLSSDLTLALAGTFYGGSGDDEALALGIDGTSWLLGGRTTSDDLPLSLHAHDRDRGGGIDGYFARFSGNGSSLDYGTLIAGELNDEVTGVAAFGGDRYGVAGTTSSASLSATRDAPQPDYAGFREGFVMGYDLATPPPVALEPACRGDADVLLDYPAGQPFLGHAGFVVRIDGGFSRAYAPTFLLLQDQLTTFGPQMLGFSSSVAVSTIMDTSSAFLMVLGTADVLGQVDFPLPIPLSPLLAGKCFAIQGLVYDNLGAFAGISVSDGVRCIFAP